jgi:hypothetical protein
MAGSLMREGSFSMRRAETTKPLMKYFNLPGKIDTSKVVMLLYFFTLRHFLYFTIYSRPNPLSFLPLLLTSMTL